MIPKRTKDTDISTEVLRGKHFKKLVDRACKEIGVAYANDTSGKSLSQYIADVARKENLNRIQIQRFVEESNTQAYLAKYEKLRDLKVRDVTFPLATLKEVLELLGADAPPEIDNPNVVTGMEGTGEMKKEASASVKHAFNDGVATGRRLLQERQAKEARLEKEASLKSLGRSRSEAIFKIAHSLVRTQQLHQNGNVAFNSMLDKVALSDDSVSSIIEKASSISQLLHKKGMLYEKHMLDLKVNEQEKVASPLLGQYTLIDTARTPFVKKIPFSGHQSVETFDDLLKVATRLERHDQDVARIQEN